MKSRSEAKVEGGCEVTRVLQTIQHDLSPSPAGPNPDVNVRMVRDPSFRRYGQTKLANILFTAELARRLDGTDVTANCFHPALVATGFNRNNGWPMSLAMTIMKPFARSPEEGHPDARVARRLPRCRDREGRLLRRQATGDPERGRAGRGGGAPSVGGQRTKAVGLPPGLLWPTDGC